MTREGRTNDRDRQGRSTVRNGAGRHHLPAGNGAGKRNASRGVYHHGRSAGSVGVVESQKHFYYKLIVTVVSTAATLLGLSQLINACLGR